MLDLATTTSASVHALTGSSRPGAVPAFAPFATAPIIPIAVPQVDAEVIDLSERVTALAVREDRLTLRHSMVDDEIEAICPRLPALPERPGTAAFKEQTVDGIVVQVCTIKTSAQALVAYQNAMAARSVQVGEIEAFVAEERRRHGLPMLEKLRRRMYRRLTRWSDRLTALQPQSSAGVKAKAEASLTIQRLGNEGDWVSNLVTSVSADALRYICAEADARAEQDRQADGELLALGRAWEASAARCRATTAAYEEASQRLDAIGIETPDVLYRTNRDHKLLGPYGSELPSGRRWYGDRASIDALRLGYPGAVGEQRRFEIVEAYDRWQAEKQAAEQSTGYAAAHAADEAAGKENYALRRKILAMPARTMDGVLLKARVARWCFLDDEDAIAQHLADEAKDSAASGEAMAFSILLDLARMLPDVAQVAPQRGAERSAA